MRLTVRHDGADRLSVRIRDHEVLVGRPRFADGTDPGPTPTELFVASLAACVAEYAEMFLERRHLLRDDDFAVECSFTASAGLPPRVETIDLSVVVPEELDERSHEALQRVVDHCAVHNSMADPPRVRIHQVIAEHA